MIVESFKHIKESNKIEVVFREPSNAMYACNPPRPVPDKVWKEVYRLEEILKECELAEEYLQAMKKTMLNDKGDCDNVRMHIAKIKGKVNTLLIAGVVERSE
jgi:tRNA nucleotidyltransferase (CCA-adding enzyme)